MVANAAFLAALVLLLAVLWVGGQTTFLAPYKYALVTRYGVTIALFLLVVYANLFAVLYGIGRRLFLKDAGVKLHHVDQQLTTPDNAVSDLRNRLLDSMHR